MDQAHAQLIGVLRRYMSEYPVFNSIPVGAPHSYARAEQDRRTALENEAKRAIARAQGED